MLTVLSAWLLADFISGVGHWYEDKVLNKPSAYRFLDQLQKDNDLHHDQPTYLLRTSWFDNISTTAVITLPISVLLFFVGAPTVIWLAVWFATFANLVHRFAHTPPAKRPLLVRMMQKTGLFISFDQHHRHHFKGRRKVKKANSQICYCPMTSWLNPILDKIKFWSLLERARG